MTVRCACRQRALQQHRCEDYRGRVDSLAGRASVYWIPPSHVSPGALVSLTESVEDLARYRYAGWLLSTLYDVDDFVLPRFEEF